MELITSTRRYNKIVLVFYARRISYIVLMSRSPHKGSRQDRRTRLICGWNGWNFFRGRGKGFSVSCNQQNELKIGKWISESTTLNQIRGEDDGLRFRLNKQTEYELSQSVRRLRVIYVQEFYSGVWSGNSNNFLLLLFLVIERKKKSALFGRTIEVGSNQNF